MEMNKTTVAVIGIAAIAVIAVAAAVILMNDNGGGGGDKPVPTVKYFEVEKDFANEAPTVMHFYLESADGSVKTLIDAAGEYEIPANPVYAIEIIDDRYAAGMFGNDLLVYTSEYLSSEDDYYLCIDFNGADAGTPAVDGSRITIALTGNALDFMSLEREACFGFDKISYHVIDEEQVDHISYGDHTVTTCPTKDIPEGKTFDYWSFFVDGSGTQYHPGDVLPYNTDLYAILKDA